MPKGNIKLVIFDLDGTLLDAYPAIIQSFNYVMRRLGYPLRPGEVIRRAVGWGDENLLRPFIKTQDLSLALAMYRKHHKGALVRKAKLFAPTIPLLKFLRKKGYRLAIASNRPSRFCAILIRHLKIKQYFDYVLCADRLKHIKPHPQILNKIMERLRVLAGQSVYVGDMAIDMQAGRRAKIKTIGLTGGSSTYRELKKERPFLIIRNISDLRKIL